MSPRNRWTTLALTLSLAGLGQAHAASVQIGEQDFADGSFVSGVTAFVTAQTGEPAPLDQFIDSDFADPVGSRFLNFSFAPGNFVAAQITLGLWDFDSRSPGSQLLRFEVDGVSLLVELDALLESHGGSQSEVNVYAVSLTGAALAALNDGSASFAIRSGGSGLQGTPGQVNDVTSGNDFGIDFARLDVRALTVPEPAGLALALAGLGALALRRRVR